MGKRQLVSLTFCLLFLIVFGPLSLSVYISSVQAQKLVLSEMKEFSARTLIRTDLVLEQAKLALENMQQFAGEDCSPEHLLKLRQVTFENRYVQEVMFVDGKKIRCSSMRSEDGGLAIQAPDVTGPNGFSIWYQAGNDLGVKKPMTQVRLGRHVVVIDSISFIDIVPRDSRIQLGVLDLNTQKVVAAWPETNPTLLAMALAKGQENFIEDEAFFDVQHSAQFPVAVVAYTPLEAKSTAWRRQLLIWLPLGLLMSALGVWVLLTLHRRFSSPKYQMQEAIRLRQFQVHFQPIVDLSSGRCAGAEALMRWQMPDGHYVAPDLFIQLAESLDLIQPLTDLLIELVFSEMGDFLAAHPDLYISINLSAQDMQSLRVPPLLNDYVTRYKVLPKQLCIEATERGFMDAEQTRPVIEALRSAGHPVYIDDFGTGYSSLSLLENLQVDALKIDKIFVDTLATDSATSKVALHIINMAHSLGLYMIAEGIELPAQADYLREHGVQYGQGWMFHKAMPAAEYIEYYRQQATDSVAH